MLYETIEHKKAELQLMNALGQAYDYEMIGLPHKYSLDCLAMRKDAAKCLFEFKCRTVASTDYDTALVNLHKVIAAQNLSRATGLKAYLVVQWTDKVGFVDFNSDKRIGLSKRRDRNDPADMFAYYPVSGFRTLNLF